MRNAEDGDDPAWAGDLDLSDKGLDECLPLTLAASGDDLVDVTGDLAQRGGRRDRGFCIDLASELVPAGRELSGSL